MSKDRKTKGKGFSTLLSTLANGATSESRKLLLKHTGEDAVNTKDLELKLAKVYSTSNSKIDVEKEFAEIHPHKEFILKYNKPKEQEKEQQQIEIKEEIKAVIEEPPVVNNDDDFYSMIGRGRGLGRCNNPLCPICNPKKANNFNNYGFDGYSNIDNANNSNQNNNQNNSLNIQSSIIVIAMVSLVALSVMFLSTKK